MGKRGGCGARVLAVAALVCSAGAARAEIEAGNGLSHPGGGGEWSATAARTVGPGQNVLQVEAGWPGINLAVLHGGDTSDIGARIGLLYGFEGTTNSVAGVQLQVPYRRMIASGDFATVAFHVDPGVTVYGNNAARGGALVGVGGPLGAVAGFRVDPRLTLDAGVDFPILLSFIHPAGVHFGPQLGGGAEYFISRDLALTFRARFGPHFAVASGGTSNEFAFSSLLGLAYNTR